MSTRTKPKPLKSDKRYKDGPRYPVIYQYEDDFKKSWKEITNVGITEVGLELSRIVTGRRQLTKAKNIKPLQSINIENEVLKLVTQTNIKKDLYKTIGKRVGLSESSVERIVLNNIKKIKDVYSKQSKSGNK
jgi:hypothetical protein